MKTLEQTTCNGLTTVYNDAAKFRASCPECSSKRVFLMDMFNQDGNNYECDNCGFVYSVVYHSRNKAA